MKPLFTIAIPCYKAAFLDQAVRSCLSQTYREFEIIIVNDASPEDIDSIIYQFDDHRIRYYKNTNNNGALNVVDTWNQCLEYARGEYILCMGDDDILLPNCLEDYFALIQKIPELDVYHTRTQIINEESLVVRLQEPRPEWESVYSLIWRRNHGGIQYIGDFLFNRKTLMNNGGFYKLPMALSSDDISVVIAATDKGIANTQTFGFQYRDNDQTITRCGNVDDTADGLFLAKQWYVNYLSQHTNNVDDELMRMITLRDIDSYYWGMFSYLIDKDLNINAKIALQKWRFLSYKYHIPLELIENRFKNYQKQKILSKINKLRKKLL